MLEVTLKLSGAHCLLASQPWSRLEASLPISRFRLPRQSRHSETVTKHMRDYPRRQNCKADPYNVTKVDVGAPTLHKQAMRNNCSLTTAWLLGCQAKMT